MKIAEAVSDQVLLRFQAETLCAAEKEVPRCCIGFISVPDGGHYTYRIYDIHAKRTKSPVTLNAIN